MNGFKETISYVQKPFSFTKSNPFPQTLKKLKPN
jgi:hypothetical protein